MRILQRCFHRPPTNEGQGQARSLAAAVLAIFVILPSTGANADPASDLASRMNEIQGGNSFVRLRLNVKDGSGKKAVSLQAQIKSQRRAGSADVLFQILWPTDRKGESVLLHQSGNSAPTARRFVLPDRLTTIGAAEIGGSFLGSDLAYHDMIENFFAWENQKIVGSETVDRKACQILESKPGGGQSSAYGSVKSWIDPSRLVPLRVEKYDAGGRLVRRIETTRVHKNDNDQYVPATLVVRRSGASSVTEIEGSRNEVNVRYGADAFTVPKMTDLSIPRK